eukprot:16442753-Heterocapsa_arctica.AAC.1
MPKAPVEDSQASPVQDSQSQSRSPGLGKRCGESMPPNRQLQCEPCRGAACCDVYWHELGGAKKQQYSFNILI